jgi:hypothetical protein
MSRSATLTPNPSPIAMGEGRSGARSPLPPQWERGLGGEGI